MFLMTEVQICCLICVRSSVHCVCPKRVIFSLYIANSNVYKTLKYEMHLNYMNTKYQSKHNHLLYNCYLWATCFGPLESSSDPTRNRAKVI